MNNQCLFISERFGFSLLLKKTSGRISWSFAFMTPYDRISPEMGHKVCSERMRLNSKYVYVVFNLNNTELNTLISVIQNKLNTVRGWSMPSTNSRDYRRQYHAAIRDLVNETIIQTVAKMSSVNCNTRRDFGTIITQPY